MLAKTREVLSIIKWGFLFLTVATVYRWPMPAPLADRLAKAYTPAWKDSWRN